MPFFKEGSAPNEAYVNIRDIDRFSAARLYIEDLWAWFCPLADEHFLSDARTHIAERFWEMYLAKAFAVSGRVPDRAPNPGPDFLVRDGEKRIWVEATVPGPGEGGDAVSELPFDGEFHLIPEEEILLRLRNAVSAKLVQWQNWRNQGIVVETDSFIVAINGRQIHPALGASTPPYILKAVFPIGPLVAVFDQKDPDVFDSFYDFRDKLRKKSGAEVSTDIFFDKNYSEISSVVYSFADMLNRPTTEGDDFVLVHNPLALAPIARRFLGRGREFWVEDGRLQERSY